MKKLPVLGLILMLPAFMMFAVSGCGDGSKTTTTTTTAKVGGGGKKEPIVAGDGVIKGVVKYAKGDPPKAVFDDRIAKNAEQLKHCAAQGETNPAVKELNTQKQDWILDKNNNVANVVVYLTPPAGKIFKEDDKIKAEFAKKTEEIDQPYCNYRPHVRAVYAEIQPVVFKNTSEVSHNVRASSLNIEKTLDSRTGVYKVDGIKASDDPHSVSCSIHPWMSAYIFAFEHPYFGRTTEKDFTYEIKNVPVDTDLTLTLWHPEIGRKDLGTVKLKKGETLTKDLEIK